VEPITEFPFFTVLYADPHAHLYALPIALLALTFALAVILGKGRWGKAWQGLLAFLIGALAIGALRPTNTWDFYTYLALGCVAVAYTFGRYFTLPASLLQRLPSLSELRLAGQRVLAVAAGVGLLVLLSFILYQPYAQWYGQGYSKVDFWNGSRTPMLSYLTHWGLFLFVIVSWMIWETLEWMASTPASALRKLAPYKGVMIALATLLLVLMILLGVKLPGLEGLPLGKGVGVAFLIIPLATWAAILLLRPDQPDVKRFVLFLVGTGLTLTLVVELFVLVGDIGRMNTVFKFYLQVWTLFSISAAGALGWTLVSLPSWRTSWRLAWQIGLIALVGSAALYTLMATRAKIQDRMVADAPHTLDGMAYMNVATYSDTWGTMDLSQDYRMIRWLQENVQGSPVIVEANLRDLYRWGSRMSIYTGLPGVVGWEWHQQQQRALTPSSWVSDRIAEIGEFYGTTDLQKAQAFLQKYNVQYIILGQQERGKYPGPGLEKFEKAKGLLWQEVYRDGDNVIYRVLSHAAQGN
jgi:YYY domain-containing protein